MKLSPLQGLFFLFVLLTIPVVMFFLTQKQSVTDVRSRAAVSTTDCTATGGTITVSGNYCVHTFTSSGTFTPACTTTAEVLVVGGGGGGGASIKTSEMLNGCNGDWGGSGGGGGGGVISNTSYSVTSGTAISVTVGNGGAGGTQNTGQKGTTGGSSVFGSLTALGGGGGGGIAGESSGLVGGSGGGAGYDCTFRCRDGAVGTSGQGNTGGQSCSPYGGGGGGAGSAAPGIHGGAGISSSISGTATYYAGGGGGGAGGVGGVGGGGCKESDYMCANNGDTNTGGGGGGAYSKQKAGGTGGSGIVIVRYIPCGTSLTTGTITPTTAGAYPSCNASCSVSPSDTCPTGMVCTKVTDGSLKCRNATCYGESDCYCYKVASTSTPTPTPVVSCNASCSTDNDCGSMICVDDNGTKKCRNAACYGKDNCICYSITNTPTPTPIPVVACNASCTSDEDCGSKICVDVNGSKKCRNAACYGATNCICYSVTSTPIQYANATPSVTETPTPTPDASLVPTSASMLVTDLLALSPTPVSFSSTTTTNASPDITITPFYDSKKQANPLITLSGTSEPYAQLSITISPDGITGTVTADNLGNWEYTVPKKLSNGSKQLTILVRTAKGGQTTKTETFTVVGGFQFPTAAVVFSLLIALGVGGYILYQKKLTASIPPPVSYTPTTTPEFQPPEATTPSSPSVENAPVGSSTTESNPPTTDILGYPPSSVQHTATDEKESITDTGMMPPMPESLQPERSDVTLTDTTSVDTAPVATDQRLPTISSPDFDS